MSDLQVPDRTGPLRVVDLFCGAGGLSAGFRAAGYEPVFALDKDQDSAETYRANHPGVPVHVGSIADLDPHRIAELAGTGVDVIVGGPSCQGFSTANRSSTKADDERNELWTHMMAVVRELRPRAFLLENVPGMVQFRSGGLGAEIVAAFEELGYQVQHRILMAADYGVPQRRRRLFIVGVEQGATFEFPTPTHHGSFRRDHQVLAERRRVEQGLLPHLSCWEAIADLPAVGPGPRRHRRVTPSPYSALLRQGAAQVSDHDAPALPPSHALLIAQVPQGGTWRDVPAHLLPERFLNMRRTDSTNLLGRLDPSLPSYTITTQFTNVTAGCNTHPFEDRSLSIREGARLQSFPDDYEFVGSAASRTRQIGNAVPPLLAHALAWQIALALRGPQAGDHHRPQPVPVPATRVTPVAPLRRGDGQDRWPTLGPHGRQRGGGPAGGGLGPSWCPRLRQAPGCDRDRPAGPRRRVRGAAGRGLRERVLPERVWPSQLPDSVGHLLVGPEDRGRSDLLVLGHRTPAGRGLAGGDRLGARRPRSGRRPGHDGGAVPDPDRPGRHRLASARGQRLTASTNRPVPASPARAGKEATLRGAGGPSTTRAVSRARPAGGESASWAGPDLTAPEEATRVRMQRQRRRDTAPELAVRREVHRRGMRFFVDRRPLQGLRRRADLLFPRRRVAVYVDGCFWHSCPVHGTRPRRNAAWWAAKLERNVTRDRETDRLLEEQGWAVVRVWEHEDAAVAADKVQAAVRSAQSQ